MIIKKPLSRAIQLALGAAAMAGMTSVPVFAQQDQQIEEVIITGSRIARSPLDSVGPMTIVDSAIIDSSSALTIEGVLTQLPQVTANGTSENNSNAGQGVRSVELRNLAEERTLVLVNGRRAVKTVLGSNLVNDLNNVPISMIERVEVLGDGSSAVYGSDAVGGVVNIMLKDFEGVEFSLGGGDSDNGGGATWNAGLVMGSNFDRGNFTFGISYQDEGMVHFQDRDFSRDPIIADFGGGSLLRGSGIPPWGRYSSPLTSPTDPNLQPGQPTTTVSSIAFAPEASTGLDYTNCGGANATGIDGYEPCRFNYNRGFPISLLNPNQSTSFLFKSDFELSHGINLFAEVGYTDREGTQFFPGLPISGSHGRYTDMIPVPFTNPNIPADALAKIMADETANAAFNGAPVPTGFNMSWRAHDAGKRVLEYQGETASTLFGLEGEFSNGWKWDTFFNWGRSETFEETNNQVNMTKLRTAVDPALCAADNGCAEAAAASGSSAIDIFGRHDVTTAFSDYILFKDTELNEYEMMQVAFNVTGDIFEVPAGTVGFAAGFEYREEEGGSRKSAVTQAGDSGGNFAAPTSGEYDVTELYVETNIPLLTDVPGARELSVDIAGRYSDYDIIGSDSTYKVGLSWRPIDDFRVRAVVSTSFRAPNIMELFGGAADSFDSVLDPCSNYGSLSPTSTVFQNCQAAGVPISFVQNAGQLRVTQGGNENLEAEEADNLTLGFVYTPEFLDGFSMTLDYYDIEVENAINKPDPVTVINNCYTSAGLSSPDCARLGRNAQGNVVRFEVLNENLNTLNSEGVDFSMGYGFDTGAGRVEVNWGLNYLIEYSETAVDGTKTVFTDRIANDISDWVGYPRIKSNIRTSLTKDNWEVALAYRYIHEADAEPLFGAADAVKEVDAVHYFDLTGSVELGNVVVLAGIDNLTDEEPEFVPGVSTNTSFVYDLMGRYYFTRVNYRF